VAWLDDLAAAFPRPRDDEPPELRARIVKELRDHLTCAYRRELVLCGDETDAERRVLEKFGDPRRIARKLWFDAMQEKIMSQRWMFACSSALSVACLAMVGFVWHGAQQSAEASRAMIASMQESNRQFVEQGRAFNALVLEKLNQPEHKAAPTALPDATRLKFRVVQGSAEGPPAPGCRVGIHSHMWKGGSSSDAMLYIGETGPDGIVDCGLMNPGPYEYFIFAPGGVYTSQQLYVRVGQPEQVETIACPAFENSRREIAFDVEWPDDLPDAQKNWGLYCEYQPTYVSVAGRIWVPFENKAAGAFGLLTENGFEDRSGRVLILPDGRLMPLPGDLKFRGKGPSDLSSATLPRIERVSSATLPLRGTKYTLRLYGVVPPDSLPPDGKSEFELKVVWFHPGSRNNVDSVEFDLANQEITKVPVKIPSDSLSRLRSAGLFSFSFGILN